MTENGVCVIEPFCSWSIESNRDNAWFYSQQISIWVMLEMHGTATGRIGSGSSHRTDSHSLWMAQYHLLWVASFRVIMSSMSLEFEGWTISFLTCNHFRTGRSPVGITFPSFPPVSDLYPILLHHYSRSNAVFCVWPCSIAQCKCICLQLWSGGMLNLMSLRWARRHVFVRVALGA